MPAYTYRCPSCDQTLTVHQSIRAYTLSPPPTCRTCIDILPSGKIGVPVPMHRDYTADSPRTQPMWPEHLNPSTGTVVRTKQQLADDLKRGDDALFARTGIEQNSVVIEAGDSSPAPEPPMG